MTRGKWWIGLFALAATTLAASPAQAGISISSWLRFGVNHASDDDREYLIDHVVTEVGQIDVGDVLRGSFTIAQLNTSFGNVGGQTDTNEWTGVFEIQVLTKATNLNGDFVFTFGPSTAFQRDWGTGAMITMFEDASNNYAGDFNDPPPAMAPPADTDRRRNNGPIDDGTPGPPRQILPPSDDDVTIGPYATEEAFIATATDGTRFWTLGFRQEQGEGWLAVAPEDNILQAFEVVAGTTFGTFNFSVNRLINGIPETGDQFVLGKLPGIFGGDAEFVGSGGLRGVFDLDTAFESASNFDVSFLIIPEPASMTIWGLIGACLGGGSWWRRRRLLALA